MNSKVKIPLTEESVYNIIKVNRPCTYSKISAILNPPGKTELRNILTSLAAQDRISSFDLAGTIYYIAIDDRNKSTRKDILITPVPPVQQPIQQEETMDFRKFLLHIAKFKWGLIASNTYWQEGKEYIYIMIGEKGFSGKFEKREFEVEGMNIVLKKWAEALKLASQ